MKYIRTKDRIIDVAICEEMTINNIKGLYISKDGHNSFIQLEDIVKQADTIEELCDEFVIVDKNGKYHLVVKDKRSLSIIAKNENVYGAIWTDKGLIYVAKMNDKGELELI